MTWTSEFFLKVSSSLQGPTRIKNHIQVFICPQGYTHPLISVGFLTGSAQAGLLAWMESLVLEVETANSECGGIYTHVRIPLTADQFPRTPPGAALTLWELDNCPGPTPPSRSPRSPRGRRTPASPRPRLPRPSPPPNHGTWLDTRQLHAGSIKTKTQEAGRQGGGGGARRRRGAGAPPRHCPAPWPRLRRPGRCRPRAPAGRGREGRGRHPVYSLSSRTETPPGNGLPGADPGVRTTRGPAWKGPSSRPVRNKTVATALGSSPHESPLFQRPPPTTVSCQPPSRVCYALRSHLSAPALPQTTLTWPLPPARALPGKGCTKGSRPARPSWDVTPLGPPHLQTPPGAEGGRGAGTTSCQKPSFPHDEAPSLLNIPTHPQPSFKLNHA